MNERPVPMAMPFHPSLTVVMQYFQHAATVVQHVDRLLLHPKVELIIHADSNTTDDDNALRLAHRQYGARCRVVHSNNVHELRGYNRAARLARAPLILFTQDDALPPASPGWADFIIDAFRILGPRRLDALGLLSGKLCQGGQAAKQKCSKLGQCGAADTRAGLTGVTGAATAAPLPVQYVDVLVMGPIAVRASTFASTGWFNESYSEPGKAAIGFEGAWASRLWASGHAVAVSCSAMALTFANGCGGRASMRSEQKRRERVTIAIRNGALWASEYPGPHGLSAVRARVDGAQRELESALVANATLRTELEALAHALGCMRSCPIALAQTWRDGISPLCR